MSKFGILAWPGFSTKKDNPYNYILYKSIEEENCVVYDFVFSLKSVIKYILNVNYKVFHIHWPTYVLFGNNERKANIRMNILFLFIKYIKMRGVKVVWTVHNLEAHEGNFPDLQKSLANFMYRQTDGFISLNKPGLYIIKEMSSNQANQRYVHLAHPHYKEYYNNTITKLQARKKLEIPEDKFVFLFLGQIRPYKNVTGLIEAYNKMDNTNTLLLIAGKVHKDMIGVLNDIEVNKNIVLYDSFIKDEELQTYFNCADLVVTPYDKVFNSGSIFLNLSFNRPTLASDSGALEELSTVVGTEWIKLYKGALSADHLMNCMRDVTTRLEGKPNLIAFEPKIIAHNTVAFYKSLFL
ncbi:glycosyltransferase [Hymenobacter sp. NBH84]|uniref:glycosyltransferase n=1 Tax=Hymenobacter sp. NBH84 TaxID=2596915 RepID=UPI001628D293|nr:glycosyltransferase [Hymenobacter sp. NBH84]QNE38258.1 glycosyltransferase [Hymenobacter sp. NBH84]